MPEIGEAVGVAIAQGVDVEKLERKCPACGKDWKKTEPTLGAVRKAIQEELCKFEKDIHDIEPSAELGYRGSVARGTVGNPNKPHFEMQPDIRGECGVKFDIDAFIFAGKVFREIKPDKAGKRWAVRHAKLAALESRMRSALSARPELEHLKPGADGFELLVRDFTEKEKV